MITDDEDDFLANVKSKKENKKADSTDLKPVDPKDFFGGATKISSKVKASKKEEEMVKKKRKNPEEEFHDDAEFSSLLKSIDDEKKIKPSPSKKAKKEQFSPTKIRQDKDQVTPSPAISTSPPQKENVERKVENGQTNKNGRKTNVSPPKKVKVEPDLQVLPKKPKDEKPTNPSKAISPTKTILDVPMDSQLWVDKYKPTNLKAIIGQQGEKSNMKKLINWLRNWPKNNLHNNGKRPPKPPPFMTHNDDGAWAKAALLSGPPGVGKTTTAYLVAKELGLDVMELNASDTRSKKMLDTCLSDALSNTSLANKVSQNRVLLMDEVDGMAGNEDRGGIAELINLLKQSKVPVICMCNDRNHQKIRSLANHCFDLRFQRPRAEQIKAAMMSICFKEKIKMDPKTLMDMITGCNQDVRQVLHHLSMLKTSDVSASSKQETESASSSSSNKTSIKMGPWDVVRKVFSKSEHSKMSLMDKSDLFFHDYSLGPLFVQENYLMSVPDAANHDRKSTMVLSSKAADSICMGDLVEKTIRSQNAWSLLPTEAMFASVIPGEYMEGHVAGQVQFPRWLGQYSRQNKFDRILQELQVHTRLSAGLAKSSLNQDFNQHLRNAILRPMIKRGMEGVPDSIEAMDFYSLMREDLDNLLEITTWPEQPDPMKAIDSKIKAAFTRSYNKNVVLPYAKEANVKKKAKVDVAANPFEEDSDDNDEDEDNIEADAMIKAKKPSAKKKAETSTATKGKGRGKKSK